MKTKYRVLLVLALIAAYFTPLAADIAQRQTLRRQALANSRDALTYQLIIKDFTGNVRDIVYTNDYELSPASDPSLRKNYPLKNLHIRWGVMWGGDSWVFLYDEIDLKNVSVVVNTGDGIQ